MAIRKLEKVILVIISICFVIWSSIFIYSSSFIAADSHRYFCLFDDAMISMRYAWNFSHGLGLVWNQGEYIQGYTNLLMTLLMSFATLVFDKSTAALFIQMLGVVFMLVSAYVSMQIATYIIPDKNYQSRTFIRILTFFCTLSYYPLAYWSIMGMETGLLTLLLLLGILSAINFSRNQNIPQLFLTSGFFSLAFLTRNDSIIFGILVWCYTIWETLHPTLKPKHKIIRLLLMSIGIYIVFVIGQTIFQYLYYGEMLPNTYILKLTGMGPIDRIKNGFRFVTPFLIVNASILVLSILELVFDFQKVKLLLISIAFSAISYQVYVGGDPWNYWRIMAPSMPFVIMLFVMAVNAIVFAISRTQAFRTYFLRNPIFPEKYIPQILVVSLIAIGLISANVRFLREILFLNKPYQVDANRNNVNTAVVLNHLTTNDATIGVYWAGSIPYFTERKAIDFLGKSDKYIAKLPPDLTGKVSWYGMNSVPGHNKYDLYYSIKTLEPTYVQDVAWGAQDLSEWAKIKYVKVEYDGICLFLLKDSPSVFWNKINTSLPVNG